MARATFTTVMSRQPRSVKHPGRAPRREAGFSIMEVMVGLSVGLLTVLIITQTLSVFQGTKNTAVAGADAQESGLFALQIMSGDIRASGGGFYSSGASSGTTNSIFSCTRVYSYDSGNPGACLGVASPIAAISGCALTSAGYTLAAPLAPVIIEAGATSGYAANSDVITLRNAPRFIGAVPTAIAADANMSTNSDITVNRGFGFRQNDLAMISAGANCTVFQVTNDPPDTTLSHAASGVYNPPTPSGWPSYSKVSQAQVYNLGDGNSKRGPVIANEYSVVTPSTGGVSLQLRTVQYGDPTDTAKNPVVSLADGIVAMRAQYGVSTNAASPDTTACASSLAVASNGWVGPDSSAWNTYWKPDKLTPALMGCIRAIRIVIVARSGNPEAAEVPASSCPAGGFGTGPCPWPNPVAGDPVIDLTTIPVRAGTNWKQYRYKVYSTIVPLRNVLWNIQSN